MSDLSRRDALTLLATTTTAAAAACRPGAPPPAPDADVPSTGAILDTAGITAQQWQTFDPFLFCAHHDDHYPTGNGRFGPSASLVGREMGQDFAGLDGWNMYHGQTVPGFPAHPHRGFETVTVVRSGMLDHSDSLGAAARYGNGDVQWLTAGAGIQHAEMFPLLNDNGPNPVELFQIWLNLPAADKMAPPHFSMLWDRTIPRVHAPDAAGRVTHVTLVAGELAGQKAPSPPPRSYASRPDAHVAIWPLRLPAGARFVIPAGVPGLHRTLYHFKGDGLRVDRTPVARLNLVRLRSDVDTPLHVDAPAGSGDVELLMLQGRPLGEPVARQGPFVMNTRAEIQQAYQDYQRTRFGGWPWQGNDPVHGRDGRFARRPDGTTEKPA